MILLIFTIWLNEDNLKMLKLPPARDDIIFFLTLVWLISPDETEKKSVETGCFMFETSKEEKMYNALDRPAV